MTNSKLRTTHVQQFDGGKWFPWEEYTDYCVWAVKFEDGSVWNVRNGWVGKPPSTLASDLDGIASMMQPVSPTRKLIEAAAFELRRCWSRISELESYGPRTHSAALEPGE